LIILDADGSRGGDRLKKLLGKKVSDGISFEIPENRC
jgi:hypothetical protein